MNKFYFYNKLKAKFCFIFVFISISLIGCSGSNGNAPAPMVINTPNVISSPPNVPTISSPSPTPIPTITVTPLLSPSPVPSSTSPVVSTPIPTPTITIMPTPVPTASTTSTMTYRNGVLIPLYTYPNPTTIWDNLIALKMQHPRVPVYVIANDSSGMSIKADPNYQSIVKKCRAVGIKVIMYVASNYAKTPITTVKGYISNQIGFYAPVDGIFIDQMSNTSGNESYYSSLTSYAHSLGAGFIVGNPGVDPLQSYVGTVDNIVASETTAYPPFATISTSKYSQAGQNTWSIIVNNSTFDNNAETQEKPYIGYIYATTDNVYGSLSKDLPAQLSFLDGP